MNENCPMCKRYRRRPGAPVEEAPAPAPTLAEEAPAEEAGASTKGAEPHPGTLGTKASKTTKPKLTEAEKAAAAQTKVPRRWRLCRRVGREGGREGGGCGGKGAEKAACEGKGGREAAAAARQAEKEEKKVNGKKKEPPAASVSRPREARRQGGPGERQAASRP